MIGVYDFCGHYEWTFEWLRREGGHDLVVEYWEHAIGSESQSHARRLIMTSGIEGMKEYWGHALDQEAAGYTMTADEKTFRIDMSACPSKGFLLRNRLQQYCDYCDHCMGWIGPLMKDAGFTVDHQHNHQGQCWWEMRKTGDPTPPSKPGERSGESDVRLRPEWTGRAASIDTYRRAHHPDAKTLDA